MKENGLYDHSLYKVDGMNDEDYLNFDQEKIHLKKYHDHHDLDKISENIDQTVEGYGKISFEDWNYAKRLKTFTRLQMNKFNRFLFLDAKKDKKNNHQWPTNYKQKWKKLKESGCKTRKCVLNRLLDESEKLFPYLFYGANCQTFTSLILRDVDVEN